MAIKLVTQIGALKNSQICSLLARRGSMRPFQYHKIGACKMERAKAVTGHEFTDLWREHSLWIILLIGAFAFDTLSTIHFMTQDGGIQYELNPFVRHSALIFGPITGTILSAFLYKSVVALCLALYLRRMRIWVLTSPIIPAIIAGFINFAY